MKKIDVFNFRRSNNPVVQKWVMLKEITMIKEDEWIEISHFPVLEYFKQDKTRVKF